MGKKLVAWLAMLVINLTMLTAMADMETHSQGQFSIGNVAPNVQSLTLYESDHTTTTTTMNPTNSYWLDIEITDANSIDDVASITVKLFYDTNAGTVGTEPDSTDSKNYVILKYTRSAGSGTSGSWEFVDEGGNGQGTSYGSWQIVDSEDPTDWTATSGTFSVEFKVGKVAHEADGTNDDWDIKITAEDSASNSGSNSGSSYSMQWYGEISAGDASFDFGSTSLGSTDVAIVTPSDHNVDLTVISNGNYKIQVKASDATGSNDYWVGNNFGGHANIVTSDPGSGEIRLKVDDDSDHTSGLVTIPPQSQGYADWLTSQTGPTEESGDTVHAYMLLDIGGSGLLQDTYVGHVYFQVANG